MEVRSWPWNAREARVSKTFQAPGAWVAAETGALLAGAGGGGLLTCVFPGEDSGWHHVIFHFMLFLLFTSLF